MEQEAVLQALREATKAMTQVAARLDALEESSEAQIVDLRSHIDTGFARFDSQLGTMNAHLDNIVREVSIANEHHGVTNKLLERDLEDRKCERERLQRIEDEEREERRQDKRDTRDIVLSAGREVWALFKQPLAYLITAAIGFAGWYFGFDHAAQDVPVQPPSQAEAHE